MQIAHLWFFKILLSKITSKLAESDFYNIFNYDEVLA